MEAQPRLTYTKQVYFLGQPYFDEDTVEEILKLPVGNGDQDYELQKACEYYFKPHRDLQVLRTLRQEPDKLRNLTES